MRRCFSLVIILLVLAAAGAAYLVYQLSEPYAGWNQPVFVQIPPHTSTPAIAARLRDAGVIRAGWPFLLLHYLRPGRTLKAGEYYFDQPLSIRQVMSKLQRGDVYYHSVTIPEGFNVFDVAGVLAATGLATKAGIDEALRDTALISGLNPQASSLEGFLFPDTYRFTRPTSARDMASAMVARFRKVYAELEARHHPARPAREVVIMASLVEKETGIPGERPMVASVFFNRLQQRMPLQCDPTVIYAAELAGRYRGTIYQSDLSSDSAYNTYTHAGLPPGPIANPGRASLEAAMAPASTDYLYFVANGQGTHHFSATLAEHSKAVSAYRHLR